ncbi:aminoacyl-tRNA hydrolase [soil metagenome]
MTADPAPGGVAVDADTGPWLVAGLGNPGPGYAGTRHNVGHLVVDLLADRIGAPWRRHRTGRADTAEGRVGTPGAGAAPRLVLMKGRGYMNESGGPVAAVADYLSVDVDRIIVIHDELDLDFNILRVKQAGGDNGHNGLRSLRRSLGSGNFARVRVGIGRPPGRQDPADYVLSAWSGVQRRELDLMVGRAADAVESITLRGVAVTQNTYNS